MIKWEQLGYWCYLLNEYEIERFEEDFSRFSNHVYYQQRFSYRDIQEILKYYNEGENTLEVAIFDIVYNLNIIAEVLDREGEYNA